jgi:protein SCO1/2
LGCIARAFAALCAALALAGCGDGGRSYEARGVVREVVREYEQIVIAHEDIPGLMPAMTMNFDVADPALLDAAEKGQAVEFTVSFDGRHYEITAIRPLGPGEAGGADGLSLAKLAAADRSPAPPFSLVDQGGSPVSLAGLRGKAVVLDFIWARCPGPCPVLTGILVDVQKALPPELRSRTQLVSITLDPENDTPEALHAYARKRGLDLSNWSFLSGPPAQVEAVTRGYGVFSARQADGSIDHLVAIFLLDPEGRVAERYIGLDHDPDEIASDVARVLAQAAPGAARSEP